MPTGDDPNEVKAAAPLTEEEIGTITEKDIREDLDGRAAQRRAARRANAEGRAGRRPNAPR